ncbi:MAG: N-formylglutamate amidohydrolase [Phycisphaerales bacterium]|nr:N-formylglutamate amidohydrolase [Phycisphaerales bacterium]
MSPNDAHDPTIFLLLTCEHGGRDVPPEYVDLFHGAEATLASHRGYDIGALGVALRMAARLSSPIVFSTVTRLLIDLNRSPDQPDLLSEFTRNLDAQEQNRLITHYYTPYRERVDQIVRLALHAGLKVVHVGIHSCTDALNGQTRDFDIALLLEEARPRERAFCECWRSALQDQAPSLRYRFNEPYNGADDGLTTTLRQRFPVTAYLGIEVEVRQGSIGLPAQQTQTGDLLAVALHESLQRFERGR